MIMPIFYSVFSEYDVFVCPLAASHKAEADFDNSSNPEPYQRIEIFDLSAKMITLTIDGLVTSRCG